MMSTSLIMRTTANHGKSKPSISHSEQRRQYLQSIYDQHNAHFTPPQQASSIAVRHSFTTQAASDSFILDSHSPLLQSACSQNSMPNLIDHKCLKSGGNCNCLRDGHFSSNSHSSSKKSKKSKKCVLHRSSKSEPNLAVAARAVAHKYHYKEQKEHQESTPPLPLSPLMRTATTPRTPMTPPKKMKGKATSQELKMVLHHFEIALNKDIEELLRTHEPHIVAYREARYRQAMQEGVTESSDVALRLRVVGDVVEHTFMRTEPPDEYTKKTDRKHFKEVATWTAKFAKDKGATASLPLIYAAWCHDIERFIVSTKCSYLPEAVDKYRKQVIHGVTSAKVALCLLRGAPVTMSEKQRIYELILHHDIPHPRDDISILGQTLIRGAGDELMYELEILMDADAFAFFQSTITYFILFKSSKNSPDWIWERVRNNVKRLRPALRIKAAQCIRALPSEVFGKMSVDEQELAHLCSESALNSPCVSVASSLTPSITPISPLMHSAPPIRNLASNVAAFPSATELPPAKY